MSTSINGKDVILVQLEKLEGSINNLNKSTTELSKKMLATNIILAVLTVLILLFTIKMAINPIFFK